MANALNDMNRPKSTSRARLASVIEVTEAGVKIKIDGEEEIREKYYNSIAMVNSGDRVLIDYISGTILILGKLLYKKG